MYSRNHGWETTNAQKNPSAFAPLLGCALPLVPHRKRGTADLPRLSRIREAA